MKNFVYFLTIIFLFVFLFVLKDTSLHHNDAAFDASNHYLVRAENNGENKRDEIKNPDRKEFSKKEEPKIIAEIEKYIKPKNSPYNLPSKISSNKIKLFLNNPYDFSYPSLKSKSLCCKFLIDLINEAESSIDFALYGINAQDEIIDSLINAKKRNVELRAVLDSDDKGIATYIDTLKLKEYAKITYDNSNYIMHNKFFIIDNKIVFTGSMNITNTGCGGYNANSVVVIEDERVAKSYTREFEQMLNGNFKEKKIDNSTELIELDENTKFRAGFSPSGDIYNKIISKELKNAKNSIRMSIFVLTNQEIIEDLIDARKRGVDVKIILDALGAKNYAEIVEKLRKNGIKAKIENWGGKNHEKTILIDEETLILGSANFSFNGISKNDENVVLIKNIEFAKFYANFFDKLYEGIDDIYLIKFPKAEGIESGNSCYDGIDNDFDGNIDKEDSGCKNVSYFLQ